MKAGTCNPRCLVLGGVGALMASLAELTAKGEVSTMLRVKEALATYMGLSIAPAYVMLLFIALGVVLTYASQVDDLKKSLYVGASIITIFLTIIPNGLPPSVGSNSSPGETGGTSWLFSPGVALAQPVAAAGDMGRIALRLHPRDGKPITAVLLTVRRAQDGSLLARSKLTPDRLEFPQPVGKYRLVIEVAGYRTTSRVVEVVADQTRTVSIELRPTWQPIQLQRFFRSN